MPQIRQLLRLKQDHQQMMMSCKSMPIPKRLTRHSEIDGPSCSDHLLPSDHRRLLRTESVDLEQVISSMTRPRSPTLSQEEMKMMPPLKTKTSSRTSLSMTDDEMNSEDEAIRELSGYA